MDFQLILLSVQLKRPEAARCPTRQNKDNGWKDIRLVLALQKNNVSRLRIQRTGLLVSQAIALSLSPNHRDSTAIRPRFVDLVEERNLRWPHSGGHRHAHRSDCLPLPHHRE